MQRPPSVPSRACRRQSIGDYRPAPRRRTSASRSCWRRPACTTGPGVQSSRRGSMPEASHPPCAQAARSGATSCATRASCAAAEAGALARRFRRLKKARTSFQVPSDAFGATSAARASVPGSLAPRAHRVPARRDPEDARQAEQLARQVGGEVGEVEEGDVRIAPAASHCRGGAAPRRAWAAEGRASRRRRRPGIAQPGPRSMGKLGEVLVADWPRRATSGRARSPCWRRGAPRRRRRAGRGRPRGTSRRRAAAGRPGACAS